MCVNGLFLWCSEGLRATSLSSAKPFFRALSFLAWTAFSTCRSLAHTSEPLFKSSFFQQAFPRHASSLGLLPSLNPLASCLGSFPANELFLCSSTSHCQCVCPFPFQGRPYALLCFQFLMLRWTLSKWSKKIGCFNQDLGR